MGTRASRATPYSVYGREVLCANIFTVNMNGVRAASTGAGE